MHFGVVLDCTELQVLERFWSAALDYEVVHRDETYVALRAKDGSRPNLVLQKVPEPKAGKNRVHLDVHTDRFVSDLARFERLVPRPRPW